MRIFPSQLPPWVSTTSTVGCNMDLLGGLETVALEGVGTLRFPWLGNGKWPLLKCIKNTCPWVFDQTRPWGAKRTVAAWFLCFFGDGSLQPEDSPYFSQGMSMLEWLKKIQPNNINNHSILTSHLFPPGNLLFVFTSKRFVAWKWQGQTIIWCFEMLLVFWLGTVVMIWPSSNLHSEYPSFQPRSCYLRCLCLFNCQSLVKVKTTGVSCWWLGDSRNIPLKKNFEGLRILKHQQSSWIWWNFNKLFEVSAPRETSNQPYIYIQYVLNIHFTQPKMYLLVLFSSCQNHFHTKTLCGAAPSWSYLRPVEVVCQLIGKWNTHIDITYHGKLWSHMPYTKKYEMIYTYIQNMHIWWWSLHVIQSWTVKFVNAALHTCCVQCGFVSALFSPHCIV